MADLDHPTLEEVLDRRTLSPFSLADFAGYLENFHCQENLEFILGLREIEGTQEQIQIPVLWNNLYHRFVLNSAPLEVNLPFNIKTQLLKSDPSFGVIPDLQLFEETQKVVLEVLRDSFSDYLRYIKKRTSELVPPCFVDFPKSPESYMSSEEVVYITPTLFPADEKPSFSNFQLAKSISKDDAIYTLPSALPSPVDRRISDFNVTSEKQPDEDSGYSCSDLDLKGSRQNSTSSSSRGSSIGSIVDSLKIGDHKSWRRAVKKFRIRRFLNDHQIEESAVME